jgi:hypothetical protein
MARKLAVSIPRFALTPPEAAAAIGVGPDFFEENVAPELRLIRRGRKRLVPVTEIERWVSQAASAAMVQGLGRTGPVARGARPPTGLRLTEAELRRSHGRGNRETPPGGLSG